MQPFDTEFQSVKQLLDRETARINNEDFIANDPVQFPRRFSRLQDIEIVSFLCATIAWGKRSMICNNCEKMLAIMEGDQMGYVQEQAYEALPDELNIHRTLFGRNMKHLLRGFHDIYAKYDSIDDFAASCRVADSDAPAWKLVEEMQRVMSAANDGRSDSRCLPTNLATTALKRVNMALRWLVRTDGIVDMGVWHSVDQRQLFVPLDVHVGDTARALGLVSRKANDRKTVVELTEMLRLMRPDDPVAYDFALFGIGIGDKYLRPDDGR